MNKIKITKEALEELYWNQRKSLRDIAKIYGFKDYHQYILRRMVEYGIPRKTISEASKGKSHSEESKRKISEAKIGKNNPQYGMKGEKSTSWKGGCEETFMNYSRREWIKQMGMEIPEGNHIHHHDKNRRNIKLSNLHCCTPQEHIGKNGIHAKMKNMNEEEKEEFINELRWKQVCRFIL